MKLLCPRGLQPSQFLSVLGLSCHLYFPHCHSTVPSFQKSPRHFALSSCSDWPSGAHTLLRKTSLPTVSPRQSLLKVVLPFFGWKGSSLHTESPGSAPFLTLASSVPLPGGEAGGGRMHRASSPSVSQDLRAIARETHVALPEPLEYHLEVAGSI